MTVLLGLVRCNFSIEVPPLVFFLPLCLSPVNQGLPSSNCQTSLDTRRRILPDAASFEPYESGDEHAKPTEIHASYILARCSLRDCAVDNGFMVFFGLFAICFEKKF